MTSRNDTKVFRLRDIKDGDEISLIYWSKKKMKTVKSKNNNLKNQSIL